MKILYYDWDSLANDDILAAFKRLEIKYEIFKHTIKDYESDETFMSDLSVKLAKVKADIIFSVNYIPLLSYAADKFGLLYYSWIYDNPCTTLYSNAVFKSCNRIYSFDSWQCEQLKNRGAKNVFHMPWAVNAVKIKNGLMGGEKNISIK